MGKSCVFVALGANLPSPWGPPRATLEAALEHLCGDGIGLVARSPWYETAPVPDLDQPWYVNGVARLDTALSPEALLARLHALEEAFGRVRRQRWEARAIDLDLIDHCGLVRLEGAPLLPHPRMDQRAFVLMPLADVAPDWRHPVDGRPIAELLVALPPGQRIRRLSPDA
ncbi:MAG: 2-amino-4-hydroxy-6-hydroxymethyldihydropteridine diphosphokinase [Proteobacteria bacterium]|nr:2-amino-4-hydroxy-6-hydroxymethyldihydropteridine diphosphokinase [Pseudomonadota bacterium]